MFEKGGYVVRKFRLLRFYANHVRDRAARDWARYHLKNLYRFQNIHQGESCFIIGNGPSLNKMDLTQLKGAICIGLNKIFLHPDIESFGVNYHVAVNELVIEQAFKDFARLNCPSFLSYRAAFQQDTENSPYNYLLTSGHHFFSTNPYGLVSEGCTVTFVALQLAYFMGFTNVYLIGVDHSFQTVGQPHEKQIMEGKDVNHFHPDYFGNQEWHLPDLEGSELAYQIARYYYKRDRRAIFDATVGGRLEVFPKISFEDALRACK